VVLSTVDSPETAGTIARALVEEKMAACVNIVPGLRSIYRWEGAVCDESELLLIIKTTEQCFESVRRRIRALHPYQLPESIAIPVVAGDQEYLGWVSSSVAPTQSRKKPA
jgi:periplasmic divalent cation tolerance protein